MWPRLSVACSMGRHYLLPSSLLTLPTFIIYFIETICFVAQARLRFTTILMPQPPNCGDLFLHSGMHVITT